MGYYEIENSRKQGDICVIHYCHHCNTNLVGRWASKVKGIPIKSEKDKEFFDFIRLKKCIICGGKLSSNFDHHFINCRAYVSKDYKSGEWQEVWSFDHHSEPHISGASLCKGFLCVPNNGSVKPLNGLERELKRGETIETKYGLGVFLFCKNEPGSVRVNFHGDSTKSILSFLEYFRLKNRDQAVENKIEEFTDKCILGSKGVPANIIENKKDFQLMDYLKQLIWVEQNIYSITERLKELYFLDYFAAKDALYSEKIILLNNNETIQKAYEEYEQTKAKNIEVDLDSFPIDYPSKPKKPKKPEEPVLAQPGLFNKKKVMAENALLTEKYECELEKYNKANEKYKSDLKKYYETITTLEKRREDEYNLAVRKAKEALENEILAAKARYEKLLEAQESSSTEIVTPEKAAHFLLEEEIKTAEKLLKKLYQLQYRMYSCGILFEKYRNFVAVSSMYEYLSSGRCETLEGPQGAYNLFENETRMNMVIGQLNQVIESLEEIKQNQFVIYSAIQETNQQLKTLNESTSQMIGILDKINEKATTMESYMSRIANNTDVIAYNTEKTAFYSKKNAELTNALGFMMALK